MTKNDISSIRHLFSGANNITEIDLTKIDMNKVTDLKETFAYCHKLKTIYVQNDYAGTSNDSDTFIDCTSLIGGAGTKYDSTFIDSTGARIDGGSSNPGYFTAISQKPSESSEAENNLESIKSNTSDTNENQVNHSVSTNVLDLNKINEDINTSETTDIQTKEIQSNNTNETNVVSKDIKQNKRENSV